MRGGGMPNAGARPSNFQDIDLDFDIMGYPVNAEDEYQDIHGFYKGVVVDTDFIITATSANESGGGDNNLICIKITGTSLGEIETDINPASGVCS